VPVNHVVSHWVFSKSWKLIQSTSKILTKFVSGGHDFFGFILAAPLSRRLREHCLWPRARLEGMDAIVWVVLLFFVNAVSPIQHSPRDNLKQASGRRSFLVTLREEHKKRVQWNWTTRMLTLPEKLEFSDGFRFLGIRGEVLWTQFYAHKYMHQGKSTEKVLAHAKSLKIFCSVSAWRRFVTLNQLLVYSICVRIALYSTTNP